MIVTDRYLDCRSSLLRRSRYRRGDSYHDAQTPHDRLHDFDVRRQRRKYPHSLDALAKCVSSPFTKKPNLEYNFNPTFISKRIAPTDAT